MSAAHECGQNARMDVNVPSLLVAIIVMSATLVLPVALVPLRQHPELRTWAWALGANTLAYVLFVLRGQVSDLLSVVLANVAVAQTLVLFYLGICRFQQREPSRWLSVAPVLLVGASFPLLLDKLPLRVMLGCSVYAAQSLACVVILIRCREQTIGRGQYLLMAGFTLATLVSLFRIGAAASGYMELLSILLTNPVQVTTFLVLIVALILFGTGLALMVHERSESQLARQSGLLEQQNRLLQQYSNRLEAANLSLTELSITDSLTGLGNRRHFDEVLRTEWERARRGGKPLALLLIDIDCFKDYNDCYGHQAGDDCLMKVATVLRTSLRRAGDLAARYGGEEFAVVPVDADLEQARQLAQAICRAVAAQALAHVRSPHGRVTVSIGVAALVPSLDAQSEPAALIRRADAALYRAKEGGRNKVEVDRLPARCVNAPS